MWSSSMVLDFIEPFLTIFSGDNGAAILRENTGAAIPHRLIIVDDENDCRIGQDLPA